MPASNGASPWYKRSIFGAILWTVGLALIHWVWTGEVPTEKDAEYVLGLVVGLLGYQKFRKTAPLPRADKPQ